MRWSLFRCQNSKIFIGMYLKSLSKIQSWPTYSRPTYSRFSVKSPTFFLETKIQRKNPAYLFYFFVKKEVIWDWICFFSASKGALGVIGTSWTSSSSSFSRSFFSISSNSKLMVRNNFIRRLTKKKPIANHYKKL